MDTQSFTANDVVSAIGEGLLDAELSAIQEAIDSRSTSRRRERTMYDFELGSKVKFNQFCGTAALRGCTGTVISRARTKLVVSLDTPVGRFVQMVNGVAKGSDVRVPPSIVDPL